MQRIQRSQCNTKWCRKCQKTPTLQCYACKRKLGIESMVGVSTKAEVYKNQTQYFMPTILGDAEMAKKHEYLCKDCLVQKQQGRVQKGKMEYFVKIKQNRLDNKYFKMHELLKVKLPKERQLFMGDPIKHIQLKNGFIIELNLETNTVYKVIENNVTSIIILEFSPVQYSEDWYHLKDKICETDLIPGNGQLLDTLPDATNYTYENVVDDDGKVMHVIMIYKLDTQRYEFMSAYSTRLDKQKMSIHCEFFLDLLGDFDGIYGCDDDEKKRFIYSSLWLMFYSAYRCKFDFNIGYRSHDKVVDIPNKYIAENQNHFYWRHKNMFCYGKIMDTDTSLSELFFKHCCSTKKDHSIYRNDFLLWSLFKFNSEGILPKYLPRQPKKLSQKGNGRGGERTEVGIDTLEHEKRVNVNAHEAGNYPNRDIPVSSRKKTCDECANIGARGGRCAGCDVHKSSRPLHGGTPEEPVCNAELLPGKRTENDAYENELLRKRIRQIQSGTGDKKNEADVKASNIGSSPNQGHRFLSPGTRSDEKMHAVGDLAVFNNVGIEKTEHARTGKLTGNISEEAGPPETQMLPKEPHKRVHQQVYASETTEHRNQAGIAKPTTKIVTGQYIKVKEFLKNDLGFTDANIDNLLMVGVDPLPAVKRGWNKWQQRGGHADKGGDDSKFAGIYKKFEEAKSNFEAWRLNSPKSNFQEWCHAYDANNGTQRRAAINEKGQTALSAAEAALVAGKYNEAKEKGAEAVRYFGEYLELNTVGKKEISGLIETAEGVIKQAENANSVEEMKRQTGDRNEEAIRNTERPETTRNRERGDKMRVLEVQARAFVLNIDMNDADFEALKVCGIATSDDNGVSVPALLKAKWLRWCKREHPDRGGDQGAFTAVQQEFDVFKEWFNEHTEEVSGKRAKMDKYEILAAQKTRGETATTAANKALADHRYEDAIDSVTEARAEFEAYIALKGIVWKMRLTRDLLDPLKTIQETAQVGIDKLKLTESITGSREAMDRYEMLVEQMERGKTATAAAETALAGLRYKDAIDSVTEALAAFLAYSSVKRLRGESKKKFEDNFLKPLRDIQNAAQVGIDDQLTESRKTKQKESCDSKKLQVQKEENIVRQQVRPGTIGVLKDQPHAILDALKEVTTKDKWIEQIHAHVHEQFDWLSKKVSEGFNVVLPSEKPNDLCNLGKGYARGQWAGCGFTDTQYKDFIANLKLCVDKLKRMSNHGSTPAVVTDRLPVSVVDMQILANPMEMTLWVWGANITNALDMGGGGGQAEVIADGKVYNGPDPVGYVVGIVTTPLNSKLPIEAAQNRGTGVQLEEEEMLAENKKRGGTATAAAEQALDDRRYEDAIHSVTEARAEFKAYIALTQAGSALKTKLRHELLDPLEIIQETAQSAINTLGNNIIQEGINDNRQNQIKTAKLQTPKEENKHGMPRQCGLGIVFEKRNGICSGVVKRVKPGSDGDQLGGIVAGDRVISVDGKLLQNVTEADLKSMTIGDEGTKALLEFIRATTDETVMLSISRLVRGLSFTNKEVREYNLASGELSRESSREDLGEAGDIELKGGRGVLKTKMTGLGLTFKSPAYNFASFSYEQNLWIVELVTQGGPASGIVHVGDQITSIDGWTFDDKSNDKSIDKLCLGRPGTEAVLNIRRPDVDKILDVTLTR